MSLKLLVSFEQVILGAECQIERVYCWKVSACTLYKAIVSIDDDLCSILTGTISKSVEITWVLENKRVNLNTTFIQYRAHKNPE